jgi:1-acyl-sn-glycerol-3-phosphate acyltransferase
MFKKLASWIFYDVWGWTIVGDFPKADKYLVVVAPHTSNWDFFIGVLIRRFTKGFDPKYLAKKELFVFPFGILFRKLGGYPVERSKNTNFVDSIVDVYNSKEKFATTITPEGMRKYNKKWKTGFYYIAQKANIPLFRVAFDFGTKRVVLDELYYINKGVDETVVEFKKYFSEFKGKNPKDGVLWPE